MPHNRIAQISGVPHVVDTRSRIDFEPGKTASGHDPRFAGMSEKEMRDFLKEEQREGVHPSLKGKHF